MNESKRRGFYTKDYGSIMNNKAVIKIFLFLLILFFIIQFLSHIFLEIGRGKSGYRNISFLRWSSMLSPIEAKPLLEYGFALLENSRKPTGKRFLGKGIYYLQKSVNSNIFNYNGHLNLGKAYLAQNSTDHSSFDMAVRAFKRAALIRGNDPRVSKDTMTILLSLWPLLNKKDKQFCTDLLGIAIGRLGREDFNSLLDAWGLYSRDITFFKGVLNKRPRFYLLAAEKLGQLEIDMAARREFLLKHANYSVAELKDLYQKYWSEQPEDLLKKLKSIFSNLNKLLSIYYPGDTESKSKQKGHFDFKKQINLDILEILFARSGWQKDSRVKEELEPFIQSYIKDLSSIDQLKFFGDFLTKKGYFDLSDLRVFYIKQLIPFKSGQYDSVIIDTENFKRSVSFVKKEFLKDYADILLLLTDAYISSRLLTRASSTLNDVRKSEDNLADFYWRKLIIERVIGPDSDEEDSTHQYERINNSRFIELASPSFKRTIYLINNKEVKIRFAETLYEQIKSAHLIQVFIDGSLIYEEYLSKLDFPIKIHIPSEKNYSKHILNIKIM